MLLLIKDQFLRFYPILIVCCFLRQQDNTNITLYLGLGRRGDKAVFSVRSLCGDDNTEAL